MDLFSHCGVLKDAPLPSNSHILISGTCGRDLIWKTYLCSWDQIRNLEMGDDPGLSGWTLPAITSELNKIGAEGDLKMLVLK